MFITERLTPAETLSELLGLKGYSKADTARFRTLRHNDDLCPGFRDRVNAMLDAYKSHRIWGARVEHRVSGFSRNSKRPY